ncbi:type VI secretion system baseplate subunit TssG [Dyadobacter pollutisoli]|uniref:Type VI secretion system baseplate subunit TssG n=1 Tax=Dyadobacter pollutisoli TaxID=2910158 RepID=A0A9E8N7F1_9BACT|nr:type VI secretion system baseplate subunit TssG [Dyadobacter pollutisoli]WAC10748.1 type VI secretion system baseplate subunit TssG [Dyadobacter pollutisoli]
MITEQKADLTAEFIACSWLEDGLLSDQILFRSLGAFKRRSHRDVETVEERELGNFKGQVIESNRSGIYDYLPEQLFHLPSSNSINTLKKKVDEIRMQREKEQKSRLFFLPLEQEFFLNRVSLAQLEQRACELDPDSELLNELKAFWQAPDSIPKKTFVRLLPVLPLISENRGNMEMASEILSTVLHLPVRINEVFGTKYFLSSNARLTGARLGMDTMFGGELDTYMAALAVTVELPDEVALEECIHNADFDTLLNWLLGWFIPVECDYSTELKLHPGASVFRLAAADEISSRLGYSELAAG